jgi:hypothetical protein
MHRSVFSIAFLISVLTVLVFSRPNQTGDLKMADGQSAVQETGFQVANQPNNAVGGVKGRVIFEGEAPRRLKLLLVKDTDVCGRVDQYDERLIVNNNNKGIQNAVVYLAGVPGGKPLSSLGNEFVMDQRGCRYQPHILLVPVNSPLEILNDDGITHNFHTFCKKNRPCNLSQPDFYKKMEITFKYPEFIHVRCDIHGWMSGWIVVVNQPYYTITDADGNFSLSDVPPGTYTLNCWQEKLGEKTEQVIIPAGGTATSTIVFNGTINSD